MTTALTFDNLRTKKQKEEDKEVLEQVKRGIQILDQKYGPDWPCHIDLETLNITDYKVCVLGQLYGGYAAGCDEIGITYSESREYGFLPAPTGLDAEITNEIWQEKIDLLQSERCG